MTETMTAAVKVGDVFYASWGYDQTNVDYYVVTALSASGKTATFMAVTSKIHSDQGPATYVTAGSSAKCARCARAIRPLVKVDGSTLWRHVSGGEERCGFRDEDERTAAPKVFKRRVKVYDYGSGASVHANLNSYSSLTKWDGKPKYQTGVGYGH